MPCNGALTPRLPGKNSTTIAHGTDRQSMRIGSKFGRSNPFALAHCLVLCRMFPGLAPYHYGADDAPRNLRQRTACSLSQRSGAGSFWSKAQAGPDRDRIPVRRLRSRGGIRGGAMDVPACLRACTQTKNAGYPGSRISICGNRDDELASPIPTWRICSTISCFRFQGRIRI